MTQKGSLVAPERLRFDFAHPRPVTSEQLREVERRVNLMVLANAASDTAQMSLGDAKQAGAIGLFGEKYGDEVRVVRIGQESVELCGGTHVARAGDIGLFKIVSEGGVAQGVRRLEAVTGTGALDWVQHTAEVVAQAAAELHARDADDLLARLEKLRRGLQGQDPSGRRSRAQARDRGRRRRGLGRGRRGRGRQAAGPQDRRRRPGHHASGAPTPCAIGSARGSWCSRPSATARPTCSWQ